MEPPTRRGIRRTPRFLIQGSVDVLVDGSPASLVNISVTGAQLVSPTIIRPKQRVRVSLVADDRTLRFNAVVAWASYEIPPDSVPRYRAGVEFVDADLSELEAYCARLRETQGP